jgi:hypothetical protein
MEDVGIFYGRFVLVFYGRLLYFEDFFLILVRCTKNNLATL